MPRQRSPNRDRAKSLWLESGKTRPLKDIAAELGVTDSQVRKWKTQDNWEGKKKGSVTKKGKGSVTKPKRQRGGQPGNQNAKGAGAPLGNQNNLKHGAYQEVYFDTLDDDEVAMIRSMQFDQIEQHLIDEIMLLTVRERRLLSRIKKYQDTQGGLTLESVVQRKMEIKGNVVYDNKQDQTETTTRTVATFEVVDRLEAKLTQVQRAKAMAISQLNNLRQTSSGKGSGNIGQLMATIEAARKKRGGGND